jgi:hypothetical protein
VVGLLGALALGGVLVSAWTPLGAVVTLLAVVALVGLGLGAGGE